MNNRPRWPIHDNATVVLPEIADGGVSIGEGALVGVLPEFAKRSNSQLEAQYGALVVGAGTILRTGCIVYRGSNIGYDCYVGDNAIVREETVIEDETVIGAGAIIENHCRIGKRVKIMSGAYLCAYTKVGDNCFVGPRACFLNDKFMGHPAVSPEKRKELRMGPTLHDNVHVGGNVTLLPGVVLASGVIVGAGCTVARSLAHPGIYYAGGVRAQYETAAFVDTPE